MKRLFWLLLALSPLLGACSSSVQVDPTRVTRSYPGANLPAASAPAMHFAARAAYVVGLEAGEGVAPGDWIEAAPGEGWPQGEETGALLSGRVVERGETWARVELAVLSGAQRSLAWTPQEAKPEALRTVTKRLLRVNASGRVPVGVGDWVSGEERYGIWSLPLEPEVRLGAQLMGVATLKPEEGQSSRVERVRGASPSVGDLLVLLDAAPLEEIEVSVSLVGFSPELQALLEEAFVQLGRGDIEVRSLPEAPPESRWHQAQLDGLEVLVVRDTTGEVRIRSQLVRLREDPALASLAIPSLPAGAQEELLVAGICAAALQLSNDSLGVVLAVEPLLAKGEGWSAHWEALAPALMDAYQQLWRPDWGLEVWLAFVELQEELPKEARGHGEGILRGALLLRQDDLIEAGLAHSKRLETLSGPTSLALAEHFYARAHPNEAARWRRHACEAGLAFECGLLRMEWALEEGEEYAPAYEEAQKWVSGDWDRLRLAQLWVRGLASPENPIDAEGLAVLGEIGRFGAPGLGLRLLIELAELAAEEDLSRAQILLEEAAVFARATGRARPYLSILSGMESVRLDMGLAPLEGALWEDYVGLLATLDRRVLLGRRALGAAGQRPDLDSQRDALEMAAELFLSVADPFNLAVASLRLARLEEASGRHQVARAHLERAKALEPAVKDAGVVALRRKVATELGLE